LYCQPSHDNNIKSNFRSSSFSSFDTNPEEVHKLINIDEKLFALIFHHNATLYNNMMSKKNINCCQAMKNNKIHTCTTIAISPTSDGGSLQKDQHI
jgi:hypothetical protein